MNWMSISTSGLLASIVLVAPAQATEEAVHPKLQDHFYLNVGGYWPSIDTTIRVDGASGVGTGINLEDDLNFQDRSVLPFALLNLRLGERWHVEGEWFDINRDSGYTTTKDLIIGDPGFTNIVIPAGSTVSSQFDTTIYRLSIGYSFLKRPDSEAGVTLGAHLTNFDLNIQETLGNTHAAADALAPLPTLGLYGAYAFSPKWLLVSRVDLFSLNYGRYSGSLIDFNLGAEYQVSDWLGLGLGYRYVEMDLKAKADGPINGEEWVGTFNYQYSGPTLYLSTTF